MRAVWYVTCLSVAVSFPIATVHGQTEWVHERLARVASSPSWLNAHVSPLGVPVFTASTGTAVSVFVGSTNLSEAILGPGYHSAVARGVTEEGLPIWWDRGGRRLFVGTEEVAANVTDVAYNQRARGGHVSYVRYIDGLYKVFVGDTDVTTMALGPTGEGRLPSAPNTDGVLAWRGRGPGTDGYWDMFAGTENLSSFLGPGRTAEGGRIDDAGHVAWIGRSPRLETGARYL